MKETREREKGFCCFFFQLSLFWSINLLEPVMYIENYLSHSLRNTQQCFVESFSLELATFFIFFSFSRHLFTIGPGYFVRLFRWIYFFRERNTRDTSKVSFSPTVSNEAMIGAVACIDQHVPECRRVSSRRSSGFLLSTLAALS